MQLNVPEHQYHNRRAQEHRIRLWWSAYVLDRSSASKLGLPMSIADDDIFVDAPSSDGINDTDEDFDDVDYSLRSIEIARIAAKCTREIYGRRKFHSPFSQRVQSVLKEFTRWMDTLPPKFHLKNDGSSSLQRHHIVYLHLRLNQVCQKRYIRTITNIIGCNSCDTSNSVARTPHPPTIAQ
jgi:proline utilization trans-activator